MKDMINSLEERQLTNPLSKKKGDGAGNWGNEASSTTTAQWDDPIATPSIDGPAGWGDEHEKPAPSSKKDDTPRWGDEDKPKKEFSKDESDSKTDEKPRGPAWDDEGFGKMTVEEYQKTIASQRAKALEDLKIGVKATRAIDQTVDLSKCSYKESTDEKEKKMAEERKKQIAEEKKRRGQQRAGEKNVDFTEFIQVKTRGRGGRGGGRGGDRAEGKPETEQQQQQQTFDRPARGGRGGRGGGGGNRVPNSKNAFPDLPPAAVKQTPAPAPAASPKSTK